MLAKHDSDENKTKKREDKQHVCNTCWLSSNGLRKRKLVISYSSENLYIRRNRGVLDITVLKSKGELGSYIYQTSSRSM